MSDAVYRPLVVVVEALESAARAKLAPASQPRTPSLVETLVETLVEILPWLREGLDDQSLRIELASSGDGVVISYRCRLCAVRHTRPVDTERLRSFRVNASGFVDALYNEFNALFTKDCPLELAPWERSR